MCGAVGRDSDCVGFDVLLSPALLPAGAPDGAGTDRFITGTQINAVIIE